MAANDRTKVPSRKHRRQHDYKLDVVTDGSEGTDPTVFLTVSRTSASAPAPARQQQPESEEKGDEDDSSAEAVVARYAVLGLSDMTARLVADQKLSWATTTKAVFCRNSQSGHNIVDDDANNGNSSEFGSGGLWGIPGLLLALRQAGAPEVTVVAGSDHDASRTEAMVDLLEVHRSHPQVHICAVPFTSEKDNIAHWWMIYQDAYITVHATCHHRLERLIYLFTCRQHAADTPCYTVAVLPSTRAGQIFLDLWKFPENRVVHETEESADGEQLDIRAILTVHSGEDGEAHLEDFLTNTKAVFPGINILLCRPKWMDDGILIRGRQLAKDWHNSLPKHITHHSFQEKKPSSRITTGTSQSGGNDKHPPTEFVMELESCSTVHLSQSNPLKIIDRKQLILQRVRPTSPEPQDINRLQTFLQPPISQPLHQDENEIDLEEEEDDGDEDSDDDKINRDENEIDLDVDEHDPSPQKRSDTAKEGASHTGLTDRPHLMVLGTGCAAPSPVRGSSGYGLLFPQLIHGIQSLDTPAQRESLLLTALFECGEGTLTMMLRHLPAIEQHTTGKSYLEGSLQLHLRHVKFIWISHAHWDHYGGLPAVLLAIHDARRRHGCEREQRYEQQSNKRLKVDSLDDHQPPVCVIAPTKVLKYLDIALQCQKGVKKSATQFFRGCTPEQIQSWWPYMSSIQLCRPRRSPSPTTNTTNSRNDGYVYRPFVFWENIRVEHSCFGAFGFVMGIRIPKKNFTGDSCGVAFSQSPNKSNYFVVTFAFSGDTRPCWKLVERCRFHCNAVSDRRLSFLLHEASFGDSEQEMSVEKKHSSLSEALQVATDVCADRVLLTHFSQRYDKYPPMKITTDQHNPTFHNRRSAFAMDGMLVPLL